MKKLFGNALNRRLALIMIAIVMLLLAIGTTFAAYTYSQHAQRTVAPYESGEMFSSNYLRTDSGEVKTIFVNSIDEHASNPSTLLTICNYPQGKQNQFNNVTINYHLKMELVKKNNSNVYVNVSENDTLDATYEATLGDLAVNNSSLIAQTATDSPETLNGGAAHSNVFTLLLSKSFASNSDIAVRITAKSTDQTLPELSCIFNVVYRSGNATANWTGEFFEAGNILPYKYDGYNYIVSGFGRGTCTITWDSSKVELSYISISEINGTNYTNDNGIKSISFAVNSNTATRHELQFYKVNIDSSVAWTGNNNSMEQIIALHFTETNE